MEKIKVLHVDDSAAIRGIVARLLESDPQIELMNSAMNGAVGVRYYKAERPDVVIMDIEMPEMDGLTALQEIMKFDKTAKVVMCSTLTVDNAEITMRAMRYGAVDYIPKPSSASSINSSADFRDKLLYLVKNIKNGSAVAPKPVTSQSQSSTTGTQSLLAPKSPIQTRPTPPLHWKPKIIAVGSSTGGPQALFDFMKGLKGTPLPVVITQHMPATFTTLLAQHITSQAGFECFEAEQGMKLQPGKAILARGGHHMEFTKNPQGEIVVNLSDTPAINFCKPAVDPMLESLIRYFGGDILSVILTGMGQDGLEGVKKLIDAGGYCVAQDFETSVVWGMPGAVSNAGLCSAVLPLADVAPWIKNNVRT